MHPDDEARLIRLEEDSWFQEEKIRFLEKALEEQRGQLDRLSEKASALTTAIAQLRALADNWQQRSTPDETPPHYQQRPW